MAKKYSDDLLYQIVPTCESVQHVLRILQSGQSGSTHAHISRRIRDLGIDTSHFRSQTIGAANLKAGGHNKKQPAVILTLDPTRRVRLPSAQLRRALLESGVPYECKVCGLQAWRGTALQLDVDHIDGNWKNNAPSNLRFLCPNCHSQTETWKNKTR